jgi:ABC-type phosphate/phosphonate transport system substrate-binding protein
MFRDVPPSMVQSLAKPFRDLMLKQVGYTGDVEVVDDPLALAEKMKDGKVQLGVFHGFEFAWAKQKCDDLVPLIITCPPGGKVQAVVVVHRSSTAKSLADLKAEGVHIPRGAKAHSLAFLDKARIGLDDTVGKPTPKVSQTPEEVLNAVALGETKAALVDVCALDGYRTLHPGGFKSLKVLHESEMFPPAVVCYRKGTITDAEATRIRTGLSSAAKSASGKMLMALWNLKGFEAPPTDYQTSLDTILKAYPLPTTDAAARGEKTVKSVSPGGK